MTDDASPPPIRWNLKDFMILTALLAVMLAVFGMVGSVILGGMAAPVWLAPRGRRMASVFWVGAFYPWFLVPLCFAFEGWLEPISRLSVFPSGSGESSFSGTYFLLLILLFSTPFVFVAMLFLSLSRVRDHSRIGWNMFVQVYELFLVPVLWMVGAILSLSLSGF
jgi:hypothetical protein